MFHGDHPDLCLTVGRAVAVARDLGHPRTGSEHLLLALSTAGGTLGEVFDQHGASETTLREMVGQAAPLGAGAAADRDILAPLGIDADRLLSHLNPAILDRPPTREPLLPTGAATARRYCARMSPPLGLDAQATCEASLRLALARRDREHRPEHLALCLVALDPGTVWMLHASGIDAEALLADLTHTFPPPNRNLLLRAERRIGRRSRHHGLIRRYQHTTGRAATHSGAVAALIVG